MGARSPSTPKPDEKPVQGKKPPPREVHCKLDTRLEGKRVTRTGQAVLTADELRFRTDRHGRDGADFNLHLAFAELASAQVDASGAILTLTTDEGEIPAELWLPESGRGPGVLVLQEIFGVSHYIQSRAADLAALREYQREQFPARAR